MHAFIFIQYQKYGKLHKTTVSFWFLDFGNPPSLIYVFQNCRYEKVYPVTRQELIFQTHLVSVLLGHVVSVLSFLFFFGPCFLVFLCQVSDLPFIVQIFPFSICKIVRGEEIFLVCNLSL